MPRLHLPSSKVVAEVIDGEAIILDLRGGSYFATDGVGAVIWTAAVQGWTTAEIAASAAAFYTDQATAGDDAAALLDAFVEANLLEPTDDSDEASASVIDWPAVYNLPVLERHDDLESMMQIDPIHDTDVSGWPAPAPR